MKTRKTALGYELQAENQEENVMIHIICQLMERDTSISDDVMNEQGCEAKSLCGCRVGSL